MAHNLVGKKFGWLTVIKKTVNRFDGKNQWECLCECGNTKVYITNMLTGSKGAKTCRSCQDHIFRKAAYISWQGAKQRCNDKGCKDYPRYGGKGVTFAAEWADFKQFYADMGEPPKCKLTNSRYTLDRIDNSKGYSKDNCKWSSPLDQANNRTNVALPVFVRKIESGDLQS